MGKEHAYRFNREMTRAVLDGRKRQTRRPITHVAGFGKVRQFEPSDTPGYGFHFRCRRGLWQDFRLADLLKRCPYGQPGDTFRLSESVNVQAVDHERYSLLFEADLMHCERYGTPELMDRIKGYKRGMLRGCTLPPAFCRSQRWEIVRVWVERVNEISDKDAKAEGIERRCNTKGYVKTEYKYYGWLEKLDQWSASPICSFQSLWESIYGEQSWEEGVWVWCVEWKAVGDA